MPEEIDKSAFPPDFMWGVSTAAHQVEGGNHNQWTEWEKASAKKLAKITGAKSPNSGAYSRIDQLPVWKDIAREARSPSNYISGRGVDHYNLYKHDFDIAKSMNLNAFRFTIEWSRIEPEEGHWNKEALEHYKNYIAELKKRNLEPVLNIWHWTMPVWFTKRGGFEKRRNVFYFERFVHKVAHELTDDVRYVITINEPNVYTSFGYLMGEYPPQKRNFIAFNRVYANLARAHRQSYYLLKARKPSLQVGIASQLANIQAKRAHSVLDEFITEWMRYFWNWWFLQKIRKEQDFIGVNYYFTDYYRLKLPFKPVDPKLPLNDLGWYMEPEGIYPLLLRVWAHYKKPIIITENGVADRKDQYRRWWIEETIIAMERAISEGVQLIGYFHWSLLDNFEWAMGWWPKFGLVEVDRRTMKRKLRPSAKWFGEQVARLRHSKAYLKGMATKE